MSIEKINAAMDESEKTGKPVDIGNVVVCDYCSKDFTDNPIAGGFLFGSYAVCPECAPGHLKSIARYKEEKLIRAFAIEGERFCDFVLRMRGGDNTVRVIKGNAK